MSAVIKHLPALQMLVPLLGALLATLSFNRRVAELIAIIAASISFVLSIHALSKAEIGYAFGNWQPPIGIEYRLDFLNQHVIIFINFSLLFLLFCGKRFIDETVISCIKRQRQFIFYAILLFAHMGYIGMVSTNDLFNLYVFIETSSLSAYVLMAQGRNLRAARGAYDYLILGSIGATLILIGIGFLLSVAGTLNITDIKLQLASRYDDANKIVVIGSMFILLGIILKMALFPLHFWLIRAYSSAPTIILTYLASISGIIGVYVFLRFIHFAVDYHLLMRQLVIVLKPVSLLTILTCSYLALQAENLKSIAIYSIVAETGYLILLLMINNSEPLILQLLIIGGINKISLLFIITHYESNMQDNYYYFYFMLITLLGSAGLPLSAMFITKLNILTMLVENNLWIEFMVIILGSILALLYHYKMASMQLSQLPSQLQSHLVLSRENIGMMLLSALQVLLLVSANWLGKHNIWHPQKFIKPVVIKDCPL